MKLLVIIPAYNAQLFIDECVSSIASQKINTQIVVIDDASSDNTLVQLRKYSQICLIRNFTNRGTYYCINLALDHFSKDPSWTHFLIHGADDVSLPDRFAKQMRAFSPNALAVGCGFRRIDYRSKRVITTNMKTNESVLIFSRKVFESIGYYDINRVGCDTEYKKRLILKHSNSILQVDEVLIKSYLHVNNLTKKIPIGGSVRKKYVSEFTKKHQIMMKNKDFYQSFIKH